MPSNPDLLDLVASIVSAHVAHNAVSPEALPGVIRSAYTALSGPGTEPPPVERPEPAVPIKKSVFSGLHRLSGGRQEAADVEAASPYLPRHDAGGIPGALEPAPRLSDGGAKIPRAPLGPRQGDRVGPQARSLGGTRGAAHTADSGGCPGQAHCANGDGHVARRLAACLELEPTDGFPATMFTVTTFTRKSPLWHRGDPFQSVQRR